MKKVLWFVYALLWIGGTVAGGVSPSTPWAAPVFLVLAGVLAVVENQSAWRSMLLAAGLGFAFEIVGVHTGFPFGRYHYTDVLAPSIAGVPIAIAFAWLILIDFVRGLTAQVWLGALLMTGIDLLIDPLAAGPLGYWAWAEKGWFYGVPATNFVGWLIASGLILWTTPKQPVRRAWVGTTVIAFFTVLAFRQRLYLPGAIGFMLLAFPFSHQISIWRSRPDRLSGTAYPDSPAS